MTGRKSDKSELNEWLQDRMKESNFTAAEVAEFMTWLGSRSKAGSESRSFVAPFQDVWQLVGWLKERIDDIVVTDEEKHEFCDWLIERISDDESLTSEELNVLREDLSKKK